MFNEAPFDRPLEPHEYPEPDDEFASDEIDCPACGAALYDDTDVCPACGEFILHDTGDPGHVWQGRSTAWIILGLLGIAAVIFALALG